MRASLSERIFNKKNIAIVSGMILNLAWFADAWASEAGGGHHLNWEDFAYRTIAFLILIGVLGKLLKKPLANFLKARREEIQRLLAELETKTAEATSEHARVRDQLASLEQETAKVVKELIAEGEAERERIIEAAHREAEYIRQQAQIAIEQEIQAARDALRDEVADLAVAAAQDLIREKIQKEDQQRLIHEFMTNVSEAK